MLFENPAVMFPYNVPGIQVQSGGIPVKNLSGVIDANTVTEHELHNINNALIPVSAVNTTLNCNSNISSNNTNTNNSNGSNTQNGLNSNGGSSSGRSTPNQLNNNSDSAPGKLFVGGLSWQTSAEKLREYFGMFGNVTDVLIMKDPITQRSRGFGFITFSEPNSVEKVLKVPIHTLDGKKIDPKYATPKNRPKQSNKTKKIFVGGVSQDTSAEEVKAYFNQFGTVEETVLLMDQQTKRHRGFGFVTFEKEETVDRVCEIHFHTIKNKKVECKKAQPKETVTPATQLQLQKRLLLSGLGLRMPTVVQNPAGIVPNPLAPLMAQAQAAQAQQQLVQQVQAQSVGQAAAPGASYGKFLPTYPPSFHALRYAPYPMMPTSSIPPAVAATPNNTSATNQTTQSQMGTQMPLSGTQPQLNANYPQLNTTYNLANLANVDMSSFQQVDWSSLSYANGLNGMGMYV